MPQALWEKASPYVLGGLIGAPLGAGVMGTFGPQYDDIEDPAERSRKRRANMLMGGVLGGALGVGGGAAYDLYRNQTPKVEGLGKNVYLAGRAASTHPVGAMMAGAVAGEAPAFINKKWYTKEVKTPGAPDFGQVAMGNGESIKDFNSYVQDLQAKGLFNKIDPHVKSQIYNSLQFTPATVQNLARQMRDPSFSKTIADFNFRQTAENYAKQTKPSDAATSTFEKELAQHLSVQRAAHISPELANLSTAPLFGERMGTALANGPGKIPWGLRAPRAARMVGNAGGAASLALLFNLLGNSGGLDNKVLGSAQTEALRQVQGR